MLHADEIFTKLPLLNFSRMVRPNARGRGRGANAPPPPDYMAGMMQQFELNRQFMQGIMNQFPNQNAHQQQGTISLQDFVRLNPVSYRNSANPLDADDWLRDITYEMESARVAPADLVTFATYFLKGPAAQWWDSHRRSLPEGTVVTWVDFQAAFRARHIPQAIMEKKKKEFRNLTQGKMSVDAYQREFLELSRYAEDDVSTDAKRQEKFREGLNHELKYILMLHPCTDFATLVNTAIQAETGQAEVQEARKRHRDTGSSSGSSESEAQGLDPTQCVPSSDPCTKAVVCCTASASTTTKTAQYYGSPSQ